MKPLVTLRCMKGCLIGSIDVLDGRLIIATRVRHVIQHTENADAGDTIVHPLEEGQPIEYGCRHSAGQPLNAGDVEELRNLALRVRHGVVRRGYTLRIE